MKQSGATRQAFNFNQISEFKIIIPDIAIQKRFVAILKGAEEVSQQQQLLEIQLLNFNNNLLSQAFKGELVA